ncbi:MAG: hypothetical protein ACP5JP_06945 [bacterium]
MFSLKNNNLTGKGKVMVAIGVMLTFISCSLLSKSSEKQTVAIPKPMCDYEAPSDYYYGIGIADLTMQGGQPAAQKKAKDDAYKAIAEQIEVSIKSKVIDEISEHKSNESREEQSKFSSFIESKSTAELHGLIPVRDCQDPTDPKRYCYVVQYSKKQYEHDVLRKIDENKQKIKNEWIMAINTPDSDLYTKLKNFVSAFNIYEENFNDLPVQGELEGENGIVPYRETILYKIQSIINNIQLQPNTTVIYFIPNGGPSLIPQIKVQYNSANGAIPLSHFPVIAEVKSGNRQIGNSVKIFSDSNGNASINDLPPIPSEYKTVSLEVKPDLTDTLELLPSNTVNVSPVNITLQREKYILLSSGVYGHEMRDIIANQGMSVNLVSENIPTDPSNLNNLKKKYDYLIISNIHVSTTHVASYGVYVSNAGGELKIYDLSAGTLKFAKTFYGGKGYGTDAISSKQQAIGLIRKDILSALESGLGQISQ